jgi:hypothetical protein
VTKELEIELFTRSNKDIWGFESWNPSESLDLLANMEEYGTK